MIIKNLYINNFGKFSDFSLDFHNGVNLVYGRNEAGKTTLINFIIMLLYGSNSKSSDLLQNERKKYRPWSGQEMKGSIVLSKNGRDYKIERTFHASNTSDIVEIFDLTTGEKVEISDDKEPGKYFFGLGYEAFKKTLYISSESSIIDNSGRKDELTRKLINLVTTGQEDLSYKKVLENIDRKIEEYSSKSGHKGILVDLNDRLDQIKIGIEEAKSDEKDKGFFMNQIDNLKARVESEDIQKEKLLRAIQIRQEKDELKENRRDIEFRISQLHSSINSGELERLEEDLGIADSLSSLEPFSLILSVILLLAGAFLNKYIYLAFAAATIFTIFKYINNSKAKKNRIAELEEEIRKVEKKNYAGYKTVNEMEEELSYIDKADRELSYVMDDLGYDYLDSNYDNLELINAKIAEIKNDMVSIESTAKERFRGKKNLSSLLLELEDIKKELLQREKEFSLLLKTRDLIVESFKQLERGFSKILNDKASEIIARITDGKYDRLFVSEDFNISILDSKTNDIKEWKYLSSGTIDQLYLSLRLAIIDLLTKEKEERILLLDDIFIKYDENRSRETLKLLKEKGDDLSQIIAFTCHDFSNYDSLDYKLIKI